MTSRRALSAGSRLVLARWWLTGWVGRRSLLRPRLIDFVAGENAVGDRDGARLREVDDVQLVPRRVEVGLDCAGRKPNDFRDFRVGLTPASPKQNFPLTR